MLTVQCMLIYVHVHNLSHCLQLVLVSPFQLQGGSTQKLSVQERAQQMLVTLPSLHRRMKIYCQPFVSSAELKESVIGKFVY